MKSWTVFLLAANVAGCAAAPGPEEAPVYLALGDSVAFGYDPTVDMRANPVAGYPELVGAQRQLEVVNAACPGEATGGFISTNGNDNGCRENRLKYPLHVEYDGTQLAFAVDFLANHPNTELVTIDIGANDISKLNHSCMAVTACVLAGFVPMITEYEKNLDFIFTQLRKNYDGPLVALAIYNPFPEDPIANYGLEKINVMLADKAKAYDGIVADGLGAVAAASNNGTPCESGMLIKLPDGKCDIHTSPTGDAVLADVIEAALGSVR